MSSFERIKTRRRARLFATPRLWQRLSERGSGASTLCLAAPIVTLIRVHVLKDCCRNLPFALTERVLCFFWQRRRVTARQTVLFGSHRCWLWEDAECVCVCVCVLSRHPLSTKCWWNLSPLFKSMRVVGWLLNETITFKFISRWIYSAFCDRLTTPETVNVNCSSRGF